jgi:hypothetical protein
LLGAAIRPTTTAYASAETRALIAINTRRVARLMA